MIEPGALGKLLDAASHEHRGRVRQGPCPVVCAHLIGDDSQLLALGGKSSHGRQEILAAKSVDPAGAQHQTSPPGRRDRSLSAKLAATIDIDRMWDGLLVVRCRGFAVEN